MKKLAIVFIVAVLVPSVVLAWLAMRSLRDQEIVVQSQLALLHQGRTDSLAADLRLAMDDIRSYFGTLVDELVEENDTEFLCTEIDPIVRSRWGQALTAAVVTEQGEWLAPALNSADARVQGFVRDNRLFLTNNIVAEVYEAPVVLGNVIQLEEMEQPADKAVGKFESGSRASIPGSTVAVATAESQQQDRSAAKQSGDVGKSSAVDSVPAGAADDVVLNDAPRNRVEVLSGKLRSLSQSLNREPAAPAKSSAAPAAEAKSADKNELREVATKDSNKRKVEPFSQLGHGGWNAAAEVAQQTLSDYDNAGDYSNFLPASGEVRDIIGDQREGALSRFLDDGLHVLLWYRHPALASKIFWVELDLEEIRKDLASVVEASAPGDSEDERGVCVALLDEESNPVARTVASFSTDWKIPFVASELGEILPHWEVAAYFLDPSQVASSAQTTRLTLWLLVPILLAAIGFGSAMIFRDVGREMHAARQKTDFVSNVSHELKTPLTSIRMFSDLLGKKSDIGAEKMGNYAGIISTEAARLTRLINNLLDFSRMERGERKYDHSEFDMVGLVNEVVENYRLQIESEGLTLAFDNRLGPDHPIRGDRDALAQVLVNLISNAEKYGANGGEIRVIAQLSDDEQQLEIKVLDRGPGISRKEAARIFDKFYRVDDSLSCGIQGSGLGLTLARQIARGHGGEVECCSRDDGAAGSCFVLRLPLAAPADSRNREMI